MSHTSILAALSLLTTGTLALAGCDKDRPTTEVPAAAGEPVPDAGVEDGAQTAADPDTVDEAVDDEPTEQTSPDTLTAPAPAPAEATVASATAEPTPTPTAAPQPKPKPKAKRKKRAKRTSSAKGEAACGEGTCG